MRILIAALGALLLLSAEASAQSQSAKVIGRPQQPQIVPSMIVLNAKAAKVAGTGLPLTR